MAKRLASNSHPTLERKILFYRIDTGSDAHGRPRNFNLSSVLQHIETLQFSDDAQGRYLAADDGNRVCCWVDECSDNGKVRVGTVRRSGLPLVEKSGILTDLPLPMVAGLAEQTHVVFFDGGIIGAEFNFYGPRVSRLAAYFREKAPGVSVPVAFEPLIRRDVTEQLERLSDVRLFQLRIRKSYAEKIAGIDENLGAAFAAAAKVSDADEIEILLSPPRYSRAGIGKQLLNTVKRLVSLGGIHEQAQKLQIRGFDTKNRQIELVDLLSDKLIVRKEIIRQGSRSRALDSESAYAAIQSAYSEVQNELILARSVAE